MASTPLSAMILLVEAAARAHRHVSQLRRAIYAGRLKATRVGTQWLVTPTALDRYIAAQDESYPRPRRPVA
jgi:excisionase family DNA binding protein